MKKLFIFDLGGVVLFKDNVLPPIAEKYSISVDALSYDFSLYEKPLEEGFMAPDDYYKHMEIKFSLPGIKEDLFSTCYSPIINDYMLQKVKELRASGYRCVIGSNTFKPHWDYIYKNMPIVFNTFDSKYASHEMHISKPDKAFWRYIMKNEECESIDIVFIDDREENVESASNIGIETFQYTKDNNKANEFFSRYIK